jgi:hypothetical protein
MKNEEIKETCVLCPHFIMTLERCAGTPNQRQIKTKGFAIPKWCPKNKKLEEKKKTEQDIVKGVTNEEVENVYKNMTHPDYEKWVNSENKKTMTGEEYAKWKIDLWDKELTNKQNTLNKPQGKRFNEGKRRWSLLDLKYLEGLVEVLEMGAIKYGDYNWTLGLPTTDIYESLMRHVIAWKSGEDKDAESGLDHIDHAICNLYFMKWMIANKPEFDSRKRVIKPNSDFEPIKYPDENEK